MKAKPVPRLERLIAVAILTLPLAACSGAAPKKTPVTVPPVVSKVAPPATSGARPASDPLQGLDFTDLIQTLRSRAASGADRELAEHVDLLAAIENHGLDATQETKVYRAKEVESAIAARWKGGTSFSTVSTYFEPAADAERVRRVYLSYDRYQEWTGKPDVSLMSREGGDAIAFANGVRNGPFGLKFGAKWRFRAHPIVRGKAFINVIRMVDAPDTEHMRETRSLLVACQEPGGCRVVEVTASSVDFDTPPLLGGIAMSIATKDVRERAASLRSRWRELPR